MPDTVALWLLLGVALAIPYVLVGHRLGDRSARLWWAGGLVLIALIYVGFPLRRGAPLPDVAFELCGVLLYGAAAVLGLRGDRAWLALGWTLHPIWDIGLHNSSETALAPMWYVWACLAFNLLVAAYLWRVARTPLDPARTSPPALS